MQALAVQHMLAHGMDMNACADEAHCLLNCCLMDCTHDRAGCMHVAASVEQANQVLMMRGCMHCRASTRSIHGTKRLLCMGLPALRRAMCPCLKRSWSALLCCSRKLKHACFYRFIRTTLPLHASICQEHHRGRSDVWLLCMKASYLTCSHKQTLQVLC